jgi:large-conductance mechanosensitive channel
MNFFKESVDVINKFNEVPVNIINSGINYISTEQQEFIKFIISSNIITICVGLIIAANVTVFIGILTEFVFAPIIQKISSGKIKDVDKFTVNILGIEFKIGMVLKGLINLFIVILMIYYIFKGVSMFNVNN